MSLVLDAGALSAVERADRDIVALIKRELLARLAPALNVIPIDATLGRRAGVLLGLANTDDVMDAALVLLSEDGDLILTSDPDDLERLAHADGLHVDIVPV